MTKLAIFSEIAQRNGGRMRKQDVAKRVKMTEQNPNVEQWCM